MFDVILVPLDGSPLSEAALPVAIDLGRKYGSEVLLLRATVVPDSVVQPTGIPGAFLSDFREREHGGIRGYLSRWKKHVEEAGVECRSLMCLHEAAEAILVEAEAADVGLIVMSSHGRGGVDRLLHGSVAEKVLRRAKCPVLLVRPGQAAGPQPEARTEATLTAH